MIFFLFSTLLFHLCFVLSTKYLQGALQEESIVTCSLSLLTTGANHPDPSALVCSRRECVYVHEHELKEAGVVGTCVEWPRVLLNSLSTSDRMYSLQICAVLRVGNQTCMELPKICVLCRAYHPVGHSLQYQGDSPQHQGPNTPASGYPLPVIRTCFLTQCDRSIPTRPEDTGRVGQGLGKGATDPNNSAEG